jgi:hypothetical protein
MSMGVPAATLHTAAKCTVLAPLLQLHKKRPPFDTRHVLQQRGKGMHAKLFTTAVTGSR